jgi:hypothetical protein
MTYVIPAWEFVADTHTLKLQRLENKVLCTIGIFLRCILVCELHMAYQVLYIYDYIIKLCRQQAGSYKIMKMQMFMTLGKVKPNTENI